MTFASRNTPLGPSLGFQIVALPATTELLTGLITLPHGCNACWLQGQGDTSFGFRIDGSEGKAASDTQSANTLPLSNRNEIDALVVCANGGAAELVVQFFTGRVGPAYR